MTKQRQLILDELSKVKSHPTADELYQMVRKQMPKISLGTVYRNLEILSDSGVIQKIDVGGTQKRFDADISNHPHIRCVKCGKVADLHVDLEFDFEDVARKASEFTILKHRLEYSGICPACES
jgi:Fur family ferric uptake transcriptional regulator